MLLPRPDFMGYRPVRSEKVVPSGLLNKVRKHEWFLWRLCMFTIMFNLIFFCVGRIRWGSWRRHPLVVVVLQGGRCLTISSPVRPGKVVR